jgi:mannose-6-phosphate isomerase
MNTEQNYESEERPWGKYTILHETPYYKVKQMLLKPGGRLSYQYHHKRNEHCVVVKGEATVTIDGVDTVVKQSESAYIPIGAKHRVANKTNQDMVYIEVQTGDYFGEDDIVRLEDDYGRSEKA